MAALSLGLGDRIEFVDTDTGDPADSLRQQNPLGKIPTLILASGEALYDSRVIVEYFDALAGGGKLIPAGGPERMKTLIRQALADGICDAAVLMIYEQRWREPDMRSARWVEHQGGKVARGMAAAETDPPAEGVADIGAIALAATLGYLDFRFEGRWRADHPRLVTWLAAFAAAVPAFEATRPPGG